MESQSEVQYVNKKREIIDRFRKEFIWENYNIDAELHSIVESLARGVDPYDVIETLIKNRQEIQKKLLELSKSEQHKTICWMCGIKIK